MRAIEPSTFVYASTNSSVYDLKITRYSDDSLEPSTVSKSFPNYVCIFYTFQCNILQVGDKTKKINELEKKLKEADEKYKRAEKQLTTKKDRVAKLEKEVST